MNDNEAADGPYAAERYGSGQTIEYPSFSSVGYSAGQVVRYAPDHEQTRRCPNCDQLSVPQPVPGHVIATRLRRCPRCEASVIFPPIAPLVYIRTLNDGKPWASPFMMRETQLRIPGRYTAHFTPEAWQRDQAIEVDAPGPQEWDCTEFARQIPGYIHWLAGRGNITRGVTDNDDLFKGDPHAPGWAAVWQGPFTITIRQETQQ
jgi:hypothetical protein